MPFNTASLNAAADGIRTAFPYVGLHSAAPDNTTGTNQTTHARLLHAAPAASGGDLAIPTKNFTGGAASGAVTHVGFWSAATGGTYGGGFALTGDQSSNAAGEYQLVGFTVDGQAV